MLTSILFSVLCGQHLQTKQKRTSCSSQTSVDMFAAATRAVGCVGRKTLQRPLQRRVTTTYGLAPMFCCVEAVEMDLSTRARCGHATSVAICISSSNPLAAVAEVWPHVHTGRNCQRSATVACRKQLRIWSAPKVYHSKATLEVAHRPIKHGQLKKNEVVHFVSILFWSLLCVLP
jgi:hypothetical protein